MTQTPENLDLWVKQYEENTDDVNCLIEQPHPYDPRFLKYFQELYTQPNYSDGQNRAIARIWNILRTSGLIHIPDHPEAGEAESQTYSWLVTPTIVLTPQLLKAVEDFCNVNESDRTLKLQTHLQTIQDYAAKEDEKDYREAQKNLRVNLENLLKAETEADQQAQAYLASYIQREPRIKLFCSYPPNSVARCFAKWVRAYFVQRTRDLERKPRHKVLREAVSLDSPIDRSESGKKSFLERIQDGAQPWQDAPTFDDIWNNDNLLAELSQAEEIFTMQESVNALEANHPLDRPHVVGYPECTHRTVAQRLILKYPPDKLESIAQNYDIPFKEFYKALPATFDAIEQHCKALGLEPQQPWRTQWELRADLLRGYIIADPDEWLCEPLNREGTYPTGQQVALCLYLKQPADSIQAIAEDFGILTAKGKAPNSFYQAIKGNTRPDVNQTAWGLKDRLVGSLVEYYPQPARLRRVIQSDSHNLLRSCYIRNHPLCNAQFLAERCLKVLGNIKTFDEIAEELTQQGSKLSTTQIQKHWYGRCLHRIGRLITILDNHDSSEESPKGGES